MKGKNCCERCYYWDKEGWLTNPEFIVEYANCCRFPQAIRKNKISWCGEFKNNNAHFNKDDE